jgi:tetratricopeptide (TPR) repeat protein
MYEPNFQVLKHCSSALEIGDSPAIKLFEMRAVSMLEQNVTFFSYQTLVDRLAHAARQESKRIVFLLGSPVSASYGNSPGVSDVDGIVEAIRSEFSGDEHAHASLQSELAQSSSSAYQVAVNFLMGRRGQDAVNTLIRQAVVRARIDPNETTAQFRQLADPDAVAESLEKDRDGWFIPACLQDLAKLCVQLPTAFGQLQLTTNFDPLLTLAIQQAGGHCYRSVLSRDGSLGQVQGDGCHIVHLHGYWRGTDTLHTPRQLNQPRPKLKSSLAELLKNSIVVPIAYGGWDDVFTRTLLEIMNEDGARPEVLWTYYGDIDADLMVQNAHQMRLFSVGLDSGRFNIYKGVSCHDLFRDLAVKLELTEPTTFTGVVPIGATASSIRDVFAQLSSAPIGDQRPEVTRSDSIPSVTDLVGRDQELARLADPQNKLVSIGGIGGQGKSSLAAFYALTCRKQPQFEFVEWRDCREQNDTLHTILLKTAQSLIGNATSIDTLKEMSIDQLAQELSSYFSQNVGILVFDNVDHYVDLHTGSPLGPLKALLDSIRPELLKTQLVFTARPQLKFESGNADSIMLRGLADKDARALFEQRSASAISDSDFGALRDVTEGHPLWILLIAARCRHQKVTAKFVLDEISSGKGALPERTILSIWNTLNDKQKTVLRTLAELERPLPESEVIEIDFELNFNQFTKALRIVKGLGLVELREQEGGGEILDLHPLIRQYIRRNFPRLEREKYISKIILALDRRLSALREIFKTNFPVAVLDVWTHKVDLSLNGGQTAQAIDSLVEIYSALVQNGLVEEFVRLSIRVFEQIDWATTCATSAKFSKMWTEAIKALSELGDFQRADSYIRRYAESIEGTGSQFINLCDTKCYRYWFEGDFEQAIFHGEKGVAIKNATQVDTSFDCAHNLALAWRDYGRIDEALQFFLGQGNEIDVLDPRAIDSHRNGAYYGNIGRCYYFRGDIQSAIICYRKSAQLLERSVDEILNRGYIRQWVGQALQKLGYFEESLVFLRAAYEIWNGFIPQRAATMESEVQALLEANPKLTRVMEMPAWRLENRFQQWVNGES